jgi:DNA-binding NtrC family response regulator
MTRNHCILFVEDEPLILMDLDHTAQERGCDTLTASTAATALRLIDFCKWRISVAVIDLDLGRAGDSITVARELKDGGIPFIWHSGSFGSSTNFQGANQYAGPDELTAPLISKPASAALVVDAALNHGAKRSKVQQGALA